MSRTQTTVSQEPLTPDELLEYDNIPASEEMPEDLLESMSERRVHVSAVEESVETNLDDLAKSLAKTASFRLPARTFLGQLGRDGQTQVAVSTAEHDAVIRPYQPPWQPRVYHPKLAPPPVDATVRGREAHRIRVHKVYAPENRTAFRPQGYPWTCIGRIEVFENGVRKRMATATLIGRRIVLTCGHAMPRDGSPGRWAIRFIPGCFDSTSTVGLSSWTEAYRALVISVSDSTQDRDLSILKLYDPLGDALGWMGMKTYNDDWEDKGVWTLVGYPDLTAGERPTFQAGIPVIDDDPSGDFTEIEHRGDASHGNSGGPLFAQFSDGPYLIGVHSGDEYRTAGPIVAEDNNVASGGRGMVNFANTMEAQWP